MRLPLRRGAVLALALVLLAAPVASAHPFFDPNELPAAEAVDAVLVVPHGCDPGGGMPGAGGASPTVVFDLQLAPEVTAFEAHELEGWDIERDGAVVRWTAGDGGSTEPIQFPVTLTVEGSVDEPIYLSAFQECEEGSFRWIGTPDREAEYPAVKLTPTQGEIGTESPDDDHVVTDEEHGHATEDHDTEHPDAPTATDGAATAAADEIPRADESAEATADGGVSWIVVSVVLLVLLGALALWAGGSRGGRT